MSSIWNNSTAQAGSSPLATNGMAPTSGGGAAEKFQSVLQAAGKTASRSQPNASAGLASPMSAATGSTSPSDSDATISANDFLTLLVTEMQNQDPTADTDPNAYIDQLVQINSLEQLISINQNLSTVLGTAASSTSGAGGNAASAAVAPQFSVASSSAESGNLKANAKSNANQQALQSEDIPGTQAMTRSGVRSLSSLDLPRTTNGNLSSPRDSPAAHTVSRSLDGHARAAPRGHSIRDIPTHSLP